MKYEKALLAFVLTAGMLTGCGSTANHLGGAADDGDVYGSNIYWDGYGINAGRDTVEDDKSKLGQDMENMTEDMKEMVKDNPVSDAVRDAVDGNTAKNLN